MESELQPVILAGGAGTRLWPRSRELYPKQFLKLIGDETMLQQALARLNGLVHVPPVIVCNEEHRFVVAEQCRMKRVEPTAIILEPAPRNTAPAVALAALRHLRREDDPLLLVLAADAYVADVEAFHSAVRRGLPFAEKGRLMVFGATPTRAETGYGYVRRGATTGDAGVAEVAAFTEKPSREVAQRYLAAGGYYWNCGMFLFRASAYLDELRTFRPDIVSACEAAVASETQDLTFSRPGEAFGGCPAESVDYAVMERTRNAMVVAADMGWTDVGSWDALADIVPSDANGNALRGDVVALDTRDSYLSAEGRLLTTLGMDGVVVVETSDAVLVADRKRAQDVKGLVDALRGASRPELRLHDTAYRPWGHAETFKAGPGFLVKRLTVFPGESLSLQMHHHRAEHWVVVQGEADIVRGDERLTLHADESTYIPVRTRHRLGNPGEVPLVVIEVQVGATLSEDDIVRFDDRYGRVPSEGPGASSR